MKMLNKETDSFMNRVRRALTLPIRTRCAELTVLFDRGSTLDLQNFFPLLIDNIFGPQGTVSWGLRVARDVNEDFRQLEHFLSPCGPIFKLIYMLLKDPSAKYDFPVIYLPVKVQQLLENSQLHPFYADLVHMNHQTKRVISLLLNPFDYYMFHFAYHLINPWHQRTGSILTSTQQPAPWNTVYYVLCCDYMLHFLPTSPGASVLPVIYYNGKNPLHPLQQISKSPVGSKLITANILNKPVEEYTLHQNFGRHPRSQIWRSETVLTIFIDMWLNNDQVNQPTNQINSSFNSTSVPGLLQYSELPSSEYMRIVRVLIKQLHAFSASASIDDTHMTELKKIAIPMVESKFYVFIRNLIHRWPLDGSFRLLLELWLTYIQPWRYPPDMAQLDLKKQTLDSDENVTAPKIVDREYLPFIAQNLLIYVVIFQQLLPRFSRVDLVSPKMSVMLYRISKVFNQPNLTWLLKEIEQSIENNHSPSHSYSSHWLSSLPPLNPTSNWCTNTNLNSSYQWSMNSTLNNSTTFGSPKSPTFSPESNSTFMNSLLGDKKWSAIVKQRIYELEGPNFFYKPLFSTPPAPEVFELIMQIKKSIRVAEELVQIKKQEEQELNASFFGLFKLLWEPPRTTDEFSLNERLKVPEYLDKSLEHLHHIFDIPELPDADLDTSLANNSNSSGMEISNDFKFLTPQKVRERMKKIKYEGDPDLYPIRSTEVTFLVRMLYQISQQINENFRQKFYQWYYDQNYWGRLSRQFLCPPMTIYRYDKTRRGSPRVSSELPPRVSLRYFAGYSFWTYLMMGWVIAVILGYSLPVYLLFLVFLVFVYKCVRAIAGNPVRHSYPTQGFGNISFDDSF